MVGSAGRVVVVGGLCLMLWSVLAAPALRRSAEASPLGLRRTAALTVLGPLARLSAFVGLDRVSRGAEVALGRDHRVPQAGLAGEPPPEGLASPGPSPLPAPRPGASGSPGMQPGTNQSPAAKGRILGPVPHPTTTRKLRVLVVGDSIGADLAIGLGRLVGGRPDFVMKIDARVATGLARPDYFNWEYQVGLDLKSFKPDLVVASFGANDDQNFLVNGRGLVLGSAEWRQTYGRRVGRIMSEVTNSGRHIVWVGMPPMKSNSFSGAMRMMNGIYRQQADGRAGVAYVDSWSLLDNRNGGYAAYLPNESGQQELLRQPDGVHLTADGGARVARAVFDVMRGLWRSPPPPSTSAPPSPASPSQVSVHPPSPRNLGLHTGAPATG
jgi:hypothetical protein